MSKIVGFSNSTIKALEAGDGQDYYVYCLIDPRDDCPFYIGKGKGNRVFSHKQVAKALLKNMGEGEFISNLKLNHINEIIHSGQDVKAYIVSYGLTENEAFSCENTLINYAKLIQKLPLTNLVNGHGNRGMLVEDSENQFGYESISIDEIKTNELILAVKIRDAFNLNQDETLNYTFDNRQDDNLKSRTLGNWVIGKSKVQQIKYIIGVNTGADNAVVSAYEISTEYSEKRIQKNGRKRYSFVALSNSIETMKKLGVYKKSLPELKFGHGSAIAYINSK